jgi:7-keto-8-aminopelargonate synthetase-like enzyme
VGVLGRRGSGTAEHHGIDDPRVVVTGSLAKAMGLQGGFVAGPAAVVASARESAAFVGSTAPPMAMAAGLHAALRVLRREPGRIRALQERAAWFHGQVCDIPGIRSHPASPVVALHPGTRARARRLAGDLSKAGIHPPFIRYPSGPRDGFFRFALNALHAWDDLERLVGVIRGCAGAGRPDGGRGT